MLKAISILLALGTLTSPATAQRAECPQGYDPEVECRRIDESIQVTPPRAAEAQQRAERPVRTVPWWAEDSSEATEDPPVRARGAGRWLGARGAWWGRGRGARPGRGAGPGVGYGRGLGRGNGRGLGWGAKVGGGGPQIVPPGRGAGPLCPCGQCRRQPASATPAEPVVDTGDLTAGEVQQWIALLQNVLETELYAAKYYEVAARALDGYPRFRNLAGAEQRHAEAISWAIRTLGGTPAPAQRAKITPPRSIAEADAHCQKIEKRVIEVFDAMIASAPTDSLSTIFQNIQRANRRHLSAVGGPSSRSVSTVGD